MRYVRSDLQTHPKQSTPRPPADLLCCRRHISVRSLGSRATSGAARVRRRLSCRRPRRSPGGVVAYPDRRGRSARPVWSPGVIARLRLAVPHFLRSCDGSAPNGPRLRSCQGRQAAGLDAEVTGAMRWRLGGLVPRTWSGRPDARTPGAAFRRVPREPRLASALTAGRLTGIARRQPGRRFSHRRPRSRPGALQPRGGQGGLAAALASFAQAGRRGEPPIWLMPTRIVEPATDRGAVRSRACLRRRCPHGPGDGHDDAGHQHVPGPAHEHQRISSDADVAVGEQRRGPVPGTPAGS